MIPSVLDQNSLISITMQALMPPEGSPRAFTEIRVFVLAFFSTNEDKTEQYIVGVVTSKRAFNREGAFMS